MFNKLLDIYLKIQDDQSGNNHFLKEIFEASFYKSFSCEDELPIERAIAKLCGIIQCTTVVQDGKERFSLKLK